MMCDDIQGCEVLGIPSEYFIDTINRYMKKESRENLRYSFFEAIKMGESNGISSIKIMSNQIMTIGKILQLIHNKNHVEPIENFYDYFKHSYFIVLERKNKIAQAVSRILAKQRNIYHLLDSQSSKDIKGVGLSSDKNIVDKNLYYSKKEIQQEIENIKNEELFLHSFLKKYNINHSIFYYEDIVENRNYVLDIAKLVDIKAEIQLSPRRLKKIAGDIGEEWVVKYIKDTTNE